MKIIRGIGLFFVMPLVIFAAGFAAGVELHEFFYPFTEEEIQTTQVAGTRNTLSVDTEYVVIEYDLLRETETETTTRLPGQYVGMGREQFLMAMENFESYPPLSERERGFVSLEVQRFSRDRVVVQKNYRFVDPDEGFYAGVYDNEVIIYLEDKSTVYINTGMRLDGLPENLQRQIILYMFLPGEESLYNFLENYTS